jgi:hypothetical protein
MREKNANVEIISHCFYVYGVITLPSVVASLSLGLVAEAPQHHQADHIGGILQPMIGRSRPFVKPPLTVATAKATVPQRRPIRACHVVVLLSEVRVYMLCRGK